MRDPLAPKFHDPYCFLGLSSTATPDEAETAMDEYNDRSPGREIEAIEAWDKIRDPARRMAIDIFRYRPPEDVLDVLRVLQKEMERLLGEMVAEAQRLQADLEFGTPKHISEVTELSLPGEDKR